MSTAAIRAHTCFTAAELYWNKSESEVACACYLEGLRILNEESDHLTPLELLKLCVIENHLLTTYVLPETKPCSPLS